MTISDKIQLLSASVSLFIGLISVFIAIFTLRQSKKITAEANRPYICIYLDIINVTNLTKYLIIKNFGNTGAIIDSISYSPKFVNRYQEECFANFSNHFIAPGQKYTCAIDIQKPYEIITFVVNYHLGKRCFTDRFLINPNTAKDMIIYKSTPGGSSGLEKIMAYSAQEIVRSNL